MMTVLWPAGSRVPDGLALPWVSYPSFKVGFRHVICSGDREIYVENWFCSLSRVSRLSWAGVRGRNFNFGRS